MNGFKSQYLILEDHLEIQLGKFWMEDLRNFDADARILWKEWMQTDWYYFHSRNCDNFIYHGSILCGCQTKPESKFSANDRQFEVYDVIWEMKYYWLQYICSLQKNHSNHYLTRNMTRWNWNIILRDGKIDWISFHSSGYRFHLWAFQIHIN